MNKRILIIGLKGLISSNLFNYLKTKKVKVYQLSFENYLENKNKNVNNFDFIINCTSNHKFIENQYQDRNDNDLRIAKKIIHSKTKLVMLSTRKVYKPKYNIRENTILKPICNYSLNKSITEKQLSKIFNKRLTILRISNLIGLPLNNINKKLHYTFMDHFFYNIHKGIIYKNGKNFKDFISIDKFDM